MNSRLRANLVNLNEHVASVDAKKLFTLKSDSAGSYPGQRSVKVLTYSAKASRSKLIQCWKTASHSLASVHIQTDNEQAICIR